MNLFKVVFDVASGNVINITTSQHVDLWFLGHHEVAEGFQSVAIHLNDSTTVRELEMLGRQITVIYGDKI